MAIISSYSPSIPYTSSSRNENSDFCMDGVVDARDRASGGGTMARTLLPLTDNLQTETVKVKFKYSLNWYDNLILNH
mgnify:CR=1 FL=1